MILAEQIKRELAERAEEVCAHLLPNGKKVGSEWHTGDVDDAPGESLCVQLTGEKAGHWCDFMARDHRGRDLVSLWMEVNACPTYEYALNEAREWMGLRQEWKEVSEKSTPPAGPEPATPTKPTKRTREDIYEQVRENEQAELASVLLDLDENGEVWRWLTEELGISAEALEEYGVGQDETGGAVGLPYYAADGELRGVKFTRLSDKETWIWPETADAWHLEVLFGTQGVPADELQALVITEKPMDALVWRTLGYPAVSLPRNAKVGGARGLDPNDLWIRDCYDWLQRFDAVYFALDNDEEGARCAPVLAHRLGEDRSRVIVWPEQVKNATDFLRTGAGAAEFAELFASASNFDPDELRKPTSYLQQVWNQLWPEDGQEPGVPLPWDMPFRLRPGEVTIWQGLTKHGKTVGMEYVQIWLAAEYGTKTCVASMEIAAEVTLENMVRQAIGQRKPDREDDLRKTLAWLDKYFWIFDCQGTANHKTMLDVFRYAARKYGIDHFIIDSLMKLDVDEEDNNEQKNFLNTLLEFAQKEGVHVHLVAHSKKPDSKHPEEKYWPDKYSVRGSAHMVDLAHNVICFWRNKGKENELYKATFIPDAAERQNKINEICKWNDALIAVQAQRRTGEEPLKQLWFDKESWQFRDRFMGSGPRDFTMAGKTVTEYMAQVEDEEDEFGGIE